MDDTIRTITMQGHPPIRTRQEPEELWLGYDCLDFGGRFLRAVRTRDGRLILWYRRNPAYDKDQSTTRYIATLPGTIHTAGSLEDARTAYRDLGKLLSDCVDDPSPVQAWLAELGYSMIAEID